MSASGTLRRTASRNMQPSGSGSTTWPCPYRYGVGIDVARAIKEPAKAQTWLLYYLVGAGQLYHRSETNPFQTFCRNDAAAIAVDWSAVRADTWYGLLRSVLTKKTKRSVLEKYIGSLKEEQLELFQDDR